MELEAILKEMQTGTDKNMKLNNKVRFYKSKREKLEKEHIDALISKSTPGILVSTSTTK